MSLLIRNLLGALYSVVSFFACAAPTTKFYLFAIIPLPAWLLVTGVFLVDGYSAVYEKVCTSWHLHLIPPDPGLLTASRDGHCRPCWWDHQWHRILPRKKIQTHLMLSCMSRRRIRNSLRFGVSLASSLSLNTSILNYSKNWHSWSHLSDEDRYRLVYIRWQGLPAVLVIRHFTCRYVNLVCTK